MAGHDMRDDALAFIGDYIQKQIRELLEDPMNEYQDPNWVQAAELFEEIIVPCGWSYFTEEIVKLAEEITERARENFCKVNYYYSEGSCSYNAIANIPNRKGYTEKEEMDYSDTIEKIESWVESYRKYENESKVRNITKVEEMSLDEILDFLADAVMLIKNTLKKLDVVGCELTQNIANKIKK